MRKIADILNTRGFTLVELVIVLAIIAIIGATILQNFMGTTDRARLRSDVRSTRVLQNASELFDAEQGTPLGRSNIETDIKALEDGGYLRNSVEIQTVGAVWAYVNRQIVLDISRSSEEIKQLVSSLDAQERATIVGVGSSGAGPDTGG